MVIVVWALKVAREETSTTTVFMVMMVKGDDMFIQCIVAMVSSAGFDKEGGRVFGVGGWVGIGWVSG